MNVEEIEKFLDKQEGPKPDMVKIDFKKRDPVYGLFLKGNDYSELKSKNFWRIVTKLNLEQWNKTKDVNLAKIFSGSDFSKLSLPKVSK